MWISFAIQNYFCKPSEDKIISICQTVIRSARPHCKYQVQAICSPSENTAITFGHSAVPAKTMECFNISEAAHVYTLPSKS